MARAVVGAAVRAAEAATAVAAAAWAWRRTATASCGCALGDTAKAQAAKRWRFLHKLS